ncbi:hypothetical protein [Lentibacter sp. XHP0401]|uniref:hypothetical protein n=1 Tax=Lentibacter sp. XHP0401 TaxID=2984334 RepID=UPI0021E96628|nr:hypothetical protein [Lentibacter sp. XHP0401]MCV2892576.1 hypothetical protein [Lentibacter sp. XHP0401]
MKKLFGVLVFVMVSGCASEILKSYVGKDVTEVMLEHGAPSNVFKLPDGRVAFQWNKDSYYTTPSNTVVYGSGAYATATTYGGGIHSYECVYTIFAKPNAQDSFTVVDFKEPSLMCE